jgi:hypothetical protein
MDAAELRQLADDFNYLLGRISKYLKNNQYIYLRPFQSWQDNYHQIAGRLNANGAVRVPEFKLTPADFSPSGKSIRQECLDRFTRTLGHQVGRLEDRIRQLEAAAAEKLARRSPLERFFHRDSNGQPIEPPPAEKRILVAVPCGEPSLHTFWQGIQPALETQGLSFFLVDRPIVDDAALCLLCQELHSCGLAICDLSGQATHVMLALGLACGTGKKLVILQQQGEAPLGLPAGHGHIRYTNAAELKTALTALLAQGSVKLCCDRDTARRPQN